MNIKKLLLLAVMPMIGLTVNAQQESKIDFTPKKGDVTLAFTLGYNSYASIEAAPLLQNYYFTASPSTNWSDKKLMVGFEGGYYISPAIRALLGGGYSRTDNPGKAEYNGTSDGVVPSYGVSPSQSSTNITAFVGADYIFGSNSVKPYVGIRGRGSYGYNEIKYDSSESMGKSVAEAWTYGGAIVFGADYIFSGGLILGCQFDLFSYTYGAVQYKPQPGLASNSNSCHNFGAIAAPTIRIGFNF